MILFHGKKKKGDTGGGGRLMSAKGGKGDAAGVLASSIEHYNKNENVESEEIEDPEAGPASGSNTDTDSSSGTNNYYVGSKTGKLNDCFEQRDFLVYFKFTAMIDGEPSTDFNNTKSAAYKKAFDEGKANYFGNVYDVNGCHLYELVNPGTTFVPGPQDKQGGTTLPVI